MTEQEKGLLPEDHSEIRLVPDGVREAWTRGSGYSTWGERERKAWAEFLASDEGRKWLSERASSEEGEQ